MRKRCAKSHMKTGILEALIVNAKGIQNNNLIGTPSYFVVAQCGNKVHKTKVSSDNDKEVWWNEKFKFEFSLKEWKQLNHLDLRIMDTEFFTYGGFVGETRIYIGGIIAEGIRKGVVEMKPSPFNVVLEDDTYKGEIKIGLKFFINKAEERDKSASIAIENNIRPKQSFWGFIINLMKIVWSKFGPNRYFH